MPAVEKSGVHLTGTDSGWPVAGTNEPGPHKDGSGTDDPNLPKASSVAGGAVTAAQEVETVGLAAGDAGTTFTLTFSGQTTSALNKATTTAAQLLAALEALSNIAPGDVAVTGPTGGPWKITFLEAGAYGDTNVAELTGTGVSVNEVQTVTISGTPAGGSFKLKLDGHETANIAFNANAAAVQSALEALDNVVPGDVAVTGGPGPGTPYTLTFAANLGNRDVNQVTATHTFTGGTSPSIATATTTAGKTGPTVSITTYAQGS